MENNVYDSVTHKVVYNGGSYETGGYFTTYSGKKINPFSDDVEYNICITDIAHASSNICRFNGHVRNFYSLAQHCVLVSYLCDPEDAFQGLLHDASEVYLSDIIRPIKETVFFESYRQLEKKLERDIAKRFNFPSEMTLSVKEADMEIVVWEAENLFSPTPEWVKEYKEKHPFKRIPKLEQLTIETQDRAFWPFNCWPPHLAKAKFLKRFFELIGLFSEDYKTEKERV